MAVETLPKSEGWPRRRGLTVYTLRRKSCGKLTGGGQSPRRELTEGQGCTLEYQEEETEPRKLSWWQSQDNGMSGERAARRSNGLRPAAWFYVLTVGPKPLSRRRWTVR